MELARSNPQFKPYTKVVILPWPTMDHRFAALFWDYYDPMDKLDLTEVQHFYDNRIGHGPEVGTMGAVPP